jgi:hypothetical protein
MSDARASIGPSGGAIDSDIRAAIARGAPVWLSLAAAPTFALMALVTARLGGAESVCAMEHGSLISGMVPMYLLMSAFHSAPWLRLVSARRSSGRRR